MIVAQALSRAIGALGPSSDSAKSDAQILLGHVLGRNRAWLIAHNDSPMTAREADAFGELCELRTRGVPVAYITGYAWFYGRKFAVNADVLIPRPETEHLVDEAVTFLRARGRSQPRVLDIGVGSGAIACSIAAEVGSAIVDGTDISAAALAVAARNARDLGVADRVRLRRGYLAEPVRGPYDAVMANLPYVPSGDMPQAPQAAGYEPRVALDGGSDGLEPYRRLVPHLAGLLAPGGLALLEAAPPTIGVLAELTSAAWPQAALEIRTDYGGRDRYLHCTNK